MLAELSPPSYGPGPTTCSNEAVQASEFEQAVAALVQYATSQPHRSKNRSWLIQLRTYMPSCLAYALKELRTPAGAGVLRMLADAAFLFPSARPIILAFLEQQMDIAKIINSLPQCDMDEVATNAVLLNSVHCCPPQHGVTALFTHHVPSIRWTAVLLMASPLRLSVPEVQALTERVLPDIHVRFRCEAALQQRERSLQALFASMWDISTQHILPHNAQQQILALREMTPAPSAYVNLCGSLVRRRSCIDGLAQSRSTQPKIVSTQAMLSAIHSSALALSSGWCLMVSGPSGCGKSCLVQHLAAVTHNDDLLELYMDANTDSRAILGNYMCSQTPGEFFWQAGPLTQAVKSGRWLVLDNLHLAPADVLTILETLVSSGVLHVPQRGAVITAHPDFRLIATVQTGTAENPEEVRHVLPRAVLAEWWHVKLPAVQRHDQVRVLAGRFPSICSLLYPLVALAHLVHVAMRPPQPPSAQARAAATDNASHGQAPPGAHVANGVWDTWAAAVQKAMSAEHLSPGELLLAVSKAPGMHDLVKMCVRLTEVGGTAAALQHLRAVDPSGVTRSQVVTVPVDARTAVLVEAADVFCGCSVRTEAKVKQLRAMARVLGLPRECGEELLGRAASVQWRAGALCVGRACLPCLPGKSGPSAHEMLMGDAGKPSKFAFTKHSTQTMESIAVAVQLAEPLLLVGESGTGKTTIIQHIARQVGKEVVAINFSSQSESSDLLGGMKPVQVGATLMSLHRKFAQLLRNTWPAGKNADFLTRVHKFVRDENWPRLTEAFDVALKKVLAARAPAVDHERPAKKAKLSVTTLSQWDEFAAEVEAAKRTVAVATQGFAFEFVEGALVHAMRTGQWLLLDEINMAPAQVLESIMCVLDRPDGGVSVLDRPGSQQLARHPDFRMFGAMNPATDTGKRHLPAQIKARFTEVYIREPQEREDLVPIITAYVPGASLAASTVDGIVAFFREARELASGLSDGSSAPAYNLRTLARSMQYVFHAASLHGMQRALFDGFAMCFAGMLDADSADAVLALLKEHILHGKAEPSLPSVTRSLPKALSQRHERFINVEGYWIMCGNEDLPEEGGPSVEDFILTATVRSHLRSVARALTMQPQCPILLQGPTSSGKTSLVEYIAKTTGHKTVRINNHQHTDLQEYLGSYSADDKGNLVFHEGALVRAARHGHWVILDELNLAPTDVLEALNRLLDDNHELFVPEIQETIKPHPQFMLFGTQNPAGAYAGRKMLSRALRSRFLQIMIPDLPSAELVTVLEQRCAIPASHAGKLVAVMNELRILRSSGNVFAGCHGLITPRDLFRWASRQGLSHEELVMHGHSLLAERLRTQDERDQVLQILESKILKSFTEVKFEPAAAYAREGVTLRDQLQQAVGCAGQSEAVQHVKHVVWTKTLQRMYFLTKQALEHKEAVLLVGETGAGKTTLCQTLAFIRKQQLVTINCNMHTEAGDFLGGYRPARNRNRAFAEFVAAYNELARAAEGAAHTELPPPPDELDAHQVTVCLQALERAVAAASSMHQNPNAAALNNALEAIRRSAAAASVPFVWEDGPLVTAMRQGCLLLVDEINLAEDAVLERLNSVLEPGRTLLLAEKGGPVAEQIVAAEGFRVVATMNPGGDHGKRELSPALSNRFTQVWVTDIDDREDVLKLVTAHLPPSAVDEVAHKIVQFWEWHRTLDVVGKLKLSNRDLLAWCQFISEMHATLGLLPAYLHGIFLVIIDGSSFGASGDPHALQSACVRHLRESTPASHLPDVDLAACLDTCSLPRVGPQEMPCGEEMEVDEGVTCWGAPPFVLPVGKLYDAHAKPRYHLGAPTTARNCFRLLRAMQVPKPILLEGSPGVGKTSLITAIAAAMGHELIRVNLSEQTEMADLLGADLPAPDGTAGVFEWAPGPLLRAVRSGAWVVLDELNLASQAVLEGLNSVLDHRREIFIPELDETVRCAASFRVFAAQNPVQEGGGRKALPGSFLNRFSRISLELLQPGDLLAILQQMHPELPTSCLECMVKTVGQLHECINLRHSFGRIGGPWEFNLRDVSRWCELVLAAGISSEQHAVALSGHYAAMLFSHKMQTKADRQQTESLLEQCWSSHPLQDEFCKHLRCPQKVAMQLTSESVCIGRCELPRSPQINTLPPGASSRGCSSATAAGLELASASVPALEWIAAACKLGWMAVVMSPDVRRATRMVRSLAAVCSQPLVEIPMSNTSDISDLLGGFEQMDFGRKLQAAMHHVQHVALLMLKHMLSSADCLADAQKPTLSMLQQVQSLHCEEDDSTAIQNAPATIKLLQQALADLRAVNMQAAWGEPATGSLRTELASAEAAVVEVAAMLRDGKVVTTGGRFVWVDGLLLSAIERGHWVLMLHANTCSAAVLDRLNSLLEPSGSLYINECGSCAGGPRIVTPHTNFRLLIVMDPADGGLSRAMRNRGVEVFLHAHKLDEHPSKQLAMEAIDRVGIPGTVMPDWLHAQLSSSKHLFRDALWQRQHNAQLLATMACLVESGSAPLEAALRTAQQLVPPAEGDVPQSTVGELTESFAAFCLQVAGSDASRRHASAPSLSSSSSSAVAFPSLAPASSSVAWQAAACLLRLPNVLMAQLVCSCIVMKSNGGPNRIAPERLPPPLITLPDPGHKQRGSVADGLKEAFAAVQYVLLNTTTELAFWVHQQLQHDWDALQRHLPSTEHLQSDADVAHIVCWYQSSLHVMQPETVAEVRKLPGELRSSFAAALTSCEQLSKCMEPIVSRAAAGRAVPRTVAELSAALSHSTLSAPILLHPVVPVVMPLLAGLLSLQRAALAGLLCNPENGSLLLQGLRQLQLAQSHIWHIATSYEWQNLERAVSQRLTFLMLIIAELWEVFTRLQATVPGLKFTSPQAALSSFSTELSSVRKALKLQSHSPDSSLLRTQAGHLQLPVVTEQCHRWLRLQKLAACFDCLHLAAPEHALASLNSASIECELLHKDSDSTPSDRHSDQRVRAAAAGLACSLSSRKMLSDGAALLLAECIRGAVPAEGAHGESFCSVVVSRTVSAIQHVMQDTSSSHAAAVGARAGALVMQPLSPQHLRHSSGVQLQAALSQLEMLTQGPLVTGALAMVTVAPQIPQAAVQRTLTQLLSQCERSSAVSPMLSAALHVVVWSAAEAEEVRMKAAHAASWYASKSSLSVLRAPLEFQPASLAQLLPWKLRESLSQPLCLPGHCAASFALCQPLPLCLNQMLNPSGVNLMALPSCKDALAQALHGLLRILAVNHRHIAHPVLLDLASVIATAAQTLHIAARFLDDAVVALAQGFAQVVLAVCTAQHAELPQIVDACSSALGPACAAMQASTVPGLPEGGDVMSRLLQCVQQVAEETAGVHDQASLAITPEFLASFGQATVVFFAWQAPLLMPPPGFDPAMMAFEEQHHVRYAADVFLSPSLRAAKATKRMPLYPDAELEVSALEQQLQHAEFKCNELQDACIPRPEPPQYHDLVSQVESCVQTILPDARNVSSSMADLIASQAEFEPAHASKLQSDCENVMASLLSWVRRSEEQFPLYADQFSPFLLAARRVHYGLSVMSTALQQHVQQRRFSVLRDPACLASCFQHPIALSARTAELWTLEDVATSCSSPDVIAVFKAAVMERLSGGNMSDHLKHALPRILTVQLQLKGQVTKLQTCELLRARQSRDMLKSALSHLVTLWNVARELQAELQLREDSLFKSSTRMDQEQLCRVIIRSEEEELDAEVSQAVAQATSMFADLMAPQDDDMQEASAGARLEDDASSIVIEQLTGLLEDTEMQRAIVEAHDRGVSGLLSQCNRISALSLAPQSPKDTHRIAESLFNMGTQLLESCGGYATSAVGSSAISSCVRQVLGRLSELNAAQHSSSSCVDVSKPCMAEMLLAVVPVDSLLATIDALLDRFPEQPMLENLQTICRRILGMSVHGSLKDAMIGVELLLANVNEWQKHSASVKENTSLAQHMEPLAALAARWRNLELSSWSTTMSKALEKNKSRAFVHWFHLMSVCCPSDGCTPEISAALPVIEQFLQSSSLGQFEARLNLLKLCCTHCSLLVACGHNSFTELVTCLQNVHLYYSQHLPAVRQALEGALENIRKEMKDFVTLQKWDHHGAYDLKLLIEKTQRKLATCSKRTEAAASELITPTLSRSAASISIELVRSVASRIEVPKDEGTAGKPTPSSPIPSSLPRPVQTVVELSGLLDRLGEVPSSVQAWITSQCSSLEHDQQQMQHKAHSSTALLGPALSDASSWRNRDHGKLMARLLANVTTTVTKVEPGGEAQTRPLPVALQAVCQVATDLYSEATSLPERMASLWSHDGQKGSRSMRKKALTDLIKALTSHGLSTSKAAVPITERPQQAWFTSKQQPELPGRVLTQMPAPLGPHESSPGYVQDLWPLVSMCCQHVMGGVHGLRMTSQGSLHSDISQREASQMCSITEHAWYLMRQQQHALHDGCEQLCVIEHFVQLLEAAAHHCSGFRAADAHAQLQEDLDALQNGLQEASLFMQQMLELCPPSSTLRSKELAQAFKAASQALTASLESLGHAEQCLCAAVAAVSPLARTHAACSVPCLPVAFTPTLLQAMEAAGGALAGCRTLVCDTGSVTISGLELPVAADGVTVRSVFPSWDRLEALLEQIARGGGCQEGPQPLSAPAADGSCRANCAGVEQFADAIEGSLQHTLLWAQEVFKLKAAQDGAGAPHAVAVLQSFFQTPSVEKLTCALAACARYVGQLPASDAQVQALVGQLRGVLAMVRVVVVALRAAVVHAVLLQAACSQLTLVLASVFMSYVKEGFGEGVSEEQDGQDGAGSGTFKQEQGTGLGDGDTADAQDVSNQIENEDQIMGAQQGMPEDEREAEQDGSKGKEKQDEEPEGVEMQQDFDGDLHDGELESDKEDDDAEAAEKELEKEMGDAGDNAEVLDEKMWFGDGDEDEAEGSEQRKDAGPSDTKSKSKGDEETRKLVAGDGEDQEEGDGSQDDNAQEVADGKEAEEQGGLMEEEDVAQQMEAQDFMQPHAEQPELQVPDDLNLDDGAMDQDTADADDAPVDAAGQDAQEQEAPSGGPDAENAEVGGEADMQQQGDDAAEAGDGDDPETAVDASDSAGDDVAEGAEQGEEQQQAEAEAGVEAAAAQAETDVDASAEEKSIAGPVGGHSAAAPEADQEGAGASEAAAAAEDERNAQERRPAAGKPQAVPEPQQADSAERDRDDREAERQDAGGAAAGGMDATPQPGVRDSSRGELEEAASRAEAQRPPSNPLHDLGSAQEQWRKDFDIIDDDADDAVDGADQQLDEEAAAGQSVKIAPKEDSSTREQALAAATQEQAEEQAGAIADPVADGEDKSAKMEVDEAAAEQDALVAPAAGASGTVEEVAEPMEIDQDDHEAEVQEAEDSMYGDLRDSRDQGNGEDGNFAAVEAVIGDVEMASEEAMGALHQREAKQGDDPVTSDRERGYELWQRCAASTAALTGELIEQLRLVLQPTLASRMSGGYKTGKRLNMKKLIRYIASSFRQDKIWMRRSSPNQRQYQVILAIDETKSMQENRCDHCAMEALTLMTSALSRLEVGTMAVAAYGGTSGTRLLHDLSQPWSDVAAAEVLGGLRFNADNTLQDTPLLDLLQTAGGLFKDERHKVSGSTGVLLPSQLLLIVADGHFHERTALQRAVRQAGCDSTGEGPLIVFIILDAAKESVLDLQQVVFEGGVPTFKKYLDGFPFPYYMVLRDIRRLPHLLADLLRQWMQVCSR